MSLPAAVWAWLTDPAHWTGPSAIPVRLGEHVAIVLVSVAIAFAIAIPIGLFIGHTNRGVRLAINHANVGRAIPSLAAIGILVPLTVLIDEDAGFRLYPTLIAMVVLAIPPILVNTYAGIAAVDADLVEAARAMGLRGDQILRRVEVPLALPAIVAGLRSANVQVIATATLGAYYGLGALGSYLVEGVAQNDDAKLFAGVVLVAGLAISSEGLLALAQRAAASPGLRVTAEPPSRGPRGTPRGAVPAA
jgi:osmoprotectant transport system permease protein